MMANWRHNRVDGIRKLITLFTTFSYVWAGCYVMIGEGGAEKKK